LPPRIVTKFPDLIRPPQGSLVRPPIAQLPPGVTTGNGRGVRPPGIQLFKTPELANLKYSPKVPFIPNHKHAGRPRVPLYFVAGLFGFGTAYWYNRTSTTYVAQKDAVWVRPTPTCYVDGKVFYRQPGSDRCFNFKSAEPGDYFQVNDKVYRWTPGKHISAEDCVDEEDRARRSVAYESWKRDNPTYLQTIAARPPKPEPVRDVVPGQLDCSSCLAGIGPVEIGNGMCSLTIANNCEHGVSFKGGISHKSGPATCEFEHNAETGEQKVVCNAPCDSFQDAQVYMSAATPKEGWTGATPACRVVDPAKIQTAATTGGSGDDIFVNGWDAVED
jgi:hypothetical protein